jgi:hypothetical protein
MPRKPVIENTSGNTTTPVTIINIAAMLQIVSSKRAG